MVLTNNTKKENEMLLNLNNDIYKMVVGLNKNENFKRLLVNTDFKLQGNKENENLLSIDLIGKAISRIPLIPNNESSSCIITTNKVIKEEQSHSAYLQVSIDIVTPLNQWEVVGGIRPLLLCNCIINFMEDFNQTNGVKYRLFNIIPITLNADLSGYRLVYHTIIDK